MNLCLRRRDAFAKILSSYSPTRGELTSVALRLGMSKATASRDVAQLRWLDVLQERMTFRKVMRMYKGLVGKTDFL